MTFEVPSDSLYLTTDINVGQLPAFLEKAVSVADLPEQQDMLLISALTAASFAMPHIKILHGRPQHVYSPNLISLVCAPPASGKGVMNYAEMLLEPIHEFLEQGGRNAIYSGDFSSASFVSALAENEGELFMIQTEMDKMGKNWKNGATDFSDMFRQAFEHETIRKTRNVGQRQTMRIDIKNPRISALLSGTLDQLKPLIGNGENGLASRFLPYIVEEKTGFDPNVLGHGDHYEENGVHVVYKELGKELFGIWDRLSCLEKDVLWSLTAEQSEMLGDIFSDAYTLAFEGFGMPDVFDATVKRMLVIILRIGAVLTVLRGGELPEVLYCGEDDFRTLVLLSEKLLRHAGLMILMLSREKKEVTLPRVKKAENLMELLPNKFTAAEAIAIGQQLGVTDRTVRLRLKAALESKSIKKTSTGNYRKTM